MDERHQRRVATNEARFREMNERLVREFEAFDGRETYSVMCECPLSNCVDMVEVRRSDYDRVRMNPRAFIVLPDHVLQAAETPIEKTDGFWIIEKIDAAGEVAEELHEPH